MFGIESLATEIAKTRDAIREAASQLAAAAEEIAAGLKAIRTTVARPGRAFCTPTREVDMDQLKFTIVLPPPSAPDVVRRELTVVDAAGHTTIGEYRPDEQEIGGFCAPQGTAITITLVDIDDAANRSQPSETTVTLEDIIAPPKPGQLGIKLVGEVFEQEPTPEPQPEHTPGPDPMPSPSPETPPATPEKPTVPPPGADAEG